MEVRTSYWQEVTQLINDSCTIPVQLFMTLQPEFFPPQVASYVSHKPAALTWDRTHQVQLMVVFTGTSLTFLECYTVFKRFSFTLPIQI